MLISCVPAGRDAETRPMQSRIREIVLQFIPRLSDTVTLLRPIMNDFSISPSDI